MLNYPSMTISIEWAYKNEHCLILYHWLKAVLWKQYNSSNLKDTQNIPLYVIVNITQAFRDYLFNDNTHPSSLFDLGNL